MGSLPHSLSAAMSIFPKASLPCLEDPLTLGHNAATWHGSGRRAAGLPRRGKKVLPPLSGSEGKQEKKKKAVCSRGSKAYKRKIKWVVEKCAHTQKWVTTLVVSYTTGQQVSLFSLLWQRMVLRRLFTYSSEVALEVTREKRGLE